MAVELPRAAYVRLMGAVFIAMFLIRVAFGLTIVTFAEYLEAGPFVYSLVVAAAPLFELITVILAGFIIDRYGRKGILLTGLGLGAFSLYGLALTKNPVLLAGVNAVHGIAAGFILVTTLAIIATFAPAAHRGREMGLFNVSNLFGWMVGFMLGFLMLDAFRGRLAYTFVMAGALATLGLLLAERWVKMPPAASAPPASQRPSLRELLRAVGNRDIILLTVPWLIVFMLVGAFITFLPRVSVQDLEIPGGRTALAILGLGVLLAGSQVFWGRLADRYGREAIMLVGASGFVLFMGLIVYSFLETNSADSQVVFENVMSHRYLLTIFLFTALAFAPAGLAAIADEAREGAQGTTMSAYSLTLSLGFILGPLIFGAISATIGGVGLVSFFALSAAVLMGLVIVRYVAVRRAGGAPRHPGV